MPLLDRDSPLDEALHAAVPRTLVESLEDLPVADFAGLGHRQELEPVEGVRSAIEIVLHHLGRLLLHLARLLEDRRLLAVEAARLRGDELPGVLRPRENPVWRMI